MAERGIIFSAPMVLTLLAGTKTQTRRFIKQPRFNADGCQPAFPLELGSLWWDYWACDRGGETHRFKVGHAVGDLLWVRENFWPWTGSASRRTTVYAADGTWIDWGSGWEGKPGGIMCGKMTPSIHMHRWRSRLDLTVTDVRVQRVQEITPEDAIAEGIEPAELTGYWRDYGPEPMPHVSPVDSYASLWRSLHRKPGQTWDENPWIAAYTFRVERRRPDGKS